MTKTNRTDSFVAGSAISTAPPATAIIRVVTDDLGVRICLRDADTIDDLGMCHAPPPIEPGDLVCLEQGPPWRLVFVYVPLPGAKAVPALARSEPPTLSD